MWRAGLFILWAAIADAQSIRGVFHGASFVPAQLDGLAPGSRFAILGDVLPADKSQVEVAVQGQLVPVLEAAADRIVAVLPAATAVGVAQIQIRIGNRVTSPIPVLVVERRPGVFTVSNDGRGSADAKVDDQRIGFLSPAGAGQTVTLRATGVGAGEPEIRVRVGKSEAVAATVSRPEDAPGIDEIRFVMPETNEPGCYVPIIVRIGDAESVPVTIAREKCEHPLNLSEDALRRLDAGELIGLGQLALESSAVDNGGQTVRQDVATASFLKVNGGELYEFAGLDLETLAALPDSCKVTQQVVFAQEAIAGDIEFGGVDTPLSRRLDAGPSLRLTGPAGAVTLDRSQFRTYGRAVTIPDGDWTFTGPGSSQMGEFTASLNVGRRITWDQAFASLIDVREPLTLNWQVSGEFDRESLIVNGQARALIDRNFGVVTAFSCVAPVKAGTFTIPKAVIEKLPPAQVQAGILQLSLFLGPQASDARFAAGEIDAGMFTRQFVLAKSRFYRN